MRLATQRVTLDTMWNIDVWVKLLCAYSEDFPYRGKRQWVIKDGPKSEMSNFRKYFVHCNGLSLRGRTHLISCLFLLVV